jgi:hypothetical protein
MSNQEMYAFGKKARKAMARKPEFHGFLDWNIFKMSFGFYQTKKKNGWTDEQVEFFGRGFRGEKEVA